MDGARIANAVASLGGSVATLRALTIDAGVDVLSFGGTKNGLLGGEAVVFLDPALARRAMYVRKQVTQLASKMRFVAAQFLALLDGGLWIDLAAHANSMAARLYERRRSIGVEGSSSDVTGRQQRLSRRRQGTYRAAAGLVLLLGLGCHPRPGSLDDVVGHH